MMGTTLEFKRWTRKVLWATAREALAFLDGLCWVTDGSIEVWIDDGNPLEVLIRVEGDDPDNPTISGVVGPLPELSKPTLPVISEGGA